MTGHEWLMSVQRRRKKLRRSDPDTYRVLTYLRDVLLDAIADGVIDPSKPLITTDDGESVTFANADDDEPCWGAAS